MAVQTDKISVLISVFNGEKTLLDSVKTITSQTYKNLEILIMDDGSTDSTFEMCKSLEKLDNRIKVYKNKNNIGLTKSLNILIEHSTGSYIARHDIDDFSSVDRLEIQLKYLLINKLDLVYARAQIINSSRIIPGLSYYLPKKFLIKFKNPFIHGTLLAKKETLISIGKYDERFIYSQDYKLAYDLLKSGSRIKILGKSLYNLNMENNISNNYKTQQKYFADCVRKNKNP